MFKIDIRSSKPIYEQIIEQVKESVLKGFLKPDDSMPSVRKLAMMLEVNPNTAAKAYQELERQGVIVTVRGRGTFINSEKKAEGVNMDEVLKKIKPFLIEMKYYGVSDSQILKEIEDLLKNLS